MNHPSIIQGGMGVAVSSWPLARAVAGSGQLGVVAGTGLDVLLSRKLQDGDCGGDLRQALACFPVPEIAERILDRHLIPGGKRPQDPYRRLPLWRATQSVAQQQLAVVANFVEVALAKQGHDGPVGINYLEKIQLPALPSLYGAMLAGVDYVLMGAGIPREIPGALDRLAEHRDADLSLHVEGARAGDDYRLRFSPREVVGQIASPLRRPTFLAIITSNVLATTMARKATGRVDGFVVEGPTAGGHNAPPRGRPALSERGEPEYGPRDEVDLDGIARLGLPFWLAGSCASPERLEQARRIGACGIQVGTAFAFSRESGLTDDLKHAVISQARLGRIRVFTDPTASPTGFPFKVVPLAGTLSEREEYDARPRTCDVGYLRHVYRKDDGSLGYRCPAEPIETYVRNGGDASDAVGRKCLCNCLLANVGLAQRQPGGYVEQPLLTSGDDLGVIAQLLGPDRDSYSAEDVVRWLTDAPASPQPS